MTNAPKVVTRSHNANANDYELTDSSPDSLGYRPEKGTLDIMTDFIQAVRATSPKEKKDSLFSPRKQANGQSQERKKGQKSANA